MGAITRAFLIEVEIAPEKEKQVVQFAPLFDRATWSLLHFKHRGGGMEVFGGGGVLLRACSEKENHHPEHRHASSG